MSYIIRTKENLKNVVFVYDEKEVFLPLFYCGRDSFCNYDFDVHVFKNLNNAKQCFKRLSEKTYFKSWMPYFEICLYSVNGEEYEKNMNSVRNLFET